MQCAYETGALCVSRMGDVLTKEQVENPKDVDDKRFCRYKKGDACEFARLRYRA